MNASQMKYVKERARKIYNDKVNQIKEKFNLKEMPLNEKLNALREGNFKVLKQPDGNQYGLLAYIAFTDDKYKNNKAEREKDMAKLEKDYSILMDELILGDNEKALELLRNFEVK